jgi:thiol-disulfide isomerase/thioredoxin/outer membrane lipoprotein-sorting protein
MNFSLVLTLALLIQGTPGKPPTDALTFLNNVTQRYVDAKSYHVEAIVEHSSSNELSRSWQENLLKAIAAPGGRYRYEGRSGGGSAILVSDGTTKWVYHVDEHQYTERAASASESEKGHVISQEEMPTMEAKQLMMQIRMLSARLKSASFLQDEKIVLDGRGIDCRVVRFTDADFKIHPPVPKIEETVWVDKSRNLVVKTASRGESYLIVGRSQAHIPISVEDTTIFPVVELDEQEPESSFNFSPPPEAKLIASFPNPLVRGPENRAAEFVGKPAPDISLKRQGKEMLLSSYRGKPIFVDFWATWCGPCAEMTRALKKLYAETSGKGLVWVSIDSDEGAGTAAAFVKQEQIPWPNYHDDDGALGKAFGREAVPLGVLIDPEGKVTFYSSGYDMAELRAAIAKLGPEFISVAAIPPTNEIAPPKP